jgi:putative membrane protein
MLIGICCGTFTGLAPGIHINLIAAILVSSISKIQFISPISAVIFIVSMSITHTFLDFIPSIFLGAPEEDTFLSILPGHEMFLKGRAQEAIIYALYGSLSAIIALIVFIPLFLLFLEPIYDIMYATIPFILIFISSYLILRDEKIFLSFFTFLLSGTIGLLTFNLPVKEPLLPLLTGLFGVSGIIISISSEKPNVKQKIIPINKIKLSKSEFLKSFVPSSLVAPFLAFLPGISSSHAATIASEIVPQEKKGFLFMMGSINTIIMALTFITVYVIGKTRSGSAAAIKDIIPNLSKSDLTFIILTILISCFIAFFLGIKISEIFSSMINKINYKFLTLSILIFLFIINIIFSNLLGILVLITSSAIGIYTIQSGARRINLMGALILPVILFYII